MNMVIEGGFRRNSEAIVMLLVFEEAEQYSIQKGLL